MVSHRMATAAARTDRLLGMSYDDSLRLSDAERNDALTALAKAVGEGRLSVDEFEERSDSVMGARTRRDIVPLFTDIPDQPIAEPKIYSRADVERAWEAGHKPKLATGLIGSLLLTIGGTSAFIGAFGAAGVGAAVGLVSASVAAFLLIPVLWIALYVLKVGPSSWHAPSPRQVERQKHKEILATQAEQRALMWAHNKQTAGELTGQALDFAKRRVDNWSQSKDSKKRSD